MRLVMMGTGAFALPAFERLLASGRNVVGLVTQPDRTGKGHHQHVNPLKERARQAGLEVFQPEKANAPESLERLKAFNADLFVVAAYGQILSASLLAIPRRGAINLHGSLLPKYRGAAPVQYAVWNGETESGVTIFQIEPKLDAGPILGVVRTPIGPKETSGELHDRLAVLAADLTISVLDRMEQGTEERHFQDATLVTKAPKIPKEAGLIDWSLPAEKIGWHVRAMQPWPMAYTYLHLPARAPQRMLILDVDPLAETDHGLARGSYRPGEAILSKEGDLLIKTGCGAVRVSRLQPAGKRAMQTSEFLRGTNVSGGEFGAETLPPRTL
ncbi:methionyl-tRNA formyltransferase [Planctomicrobium sp. SH664]|uniref:methionyl-tRNA formyltransferase n=1 Tax=Planctomicrobium sp. SH664 TaxID=3448125 RepID=UPI003F5B7CD4